MASALAIEIREAVKAAIEEWRPVQSRLLTTAEAAQYLKLSLRSMKAMQSHGDIPVVRTGRRVMVDIRDLDEWIEENKSR